MASLRRCCYILLFLALAHFIEVLTVLIVLCEDISKLWTKNWLDFTGSQCFSSAIYSYSAAIGDSIVDSLIFALPIPYVWQLSKLKIRQRLGLVLIFGLGFIVCIVALLQIPFIKRREGNMRYFGSAVNILVAIQISFAIIAASLPDLRALIARSFSKFSPQFLAVMKKDTEVVGVTSSKDFQIRTQLKAFVQRLRARGCSENQIG